MLDEMIVVIAGIKDEKKLGRLLGAVARRLCEVVGDETTAALLRGTAHAIEEKVKFGRERGIQ